MEIFVHCIDTVSKEMNILLLVKHDSPDKLKFYGGTVKQRQAANLARCGNCFSQNALIFSTT